MILHDNNGNDKSGIVLYVNICSWLWDFDLGYLNPFALDSEGVKSSKTLVDWCHELGIPCSTPMWLLEELEIPISWILTQKHLLKLYLARIPHFRTIPFTWLDWINKSWCAWKTDTTKTCCSISCLRLKTSLASVCVCLSAWFETTFRMDVQAPKQRT